MQPQPSARHLVVAVAGLLAVALGGCDFSRKIDRSGAEGLVDSILTRENVKPSKVTCPEGEPLKAGHVFECTAVAHEIEIHFKMEVIDDKGTVVATPRDHTLVVAKVEPEIKADLEATGHQVESIDCHGDVWVAIEGATVTCDIVDKEGKEYLWTATFTDDKGTHNHKIAPK